MLKKFFMLLVLSLVFCVEVFAATSVKIFTLDEAVSESNQIKPRIYIENTGDEAVSNFTYEYSFTLNSNETPIIEDYFTPNSVVSLESNGENSYTLVYDFTGETLEAGTSFPENSGAVVGIHYSDWSEISLSEALTADFVENESIKVFDENGNQINVTSNGFPIADAGPDVVWYVENSNDVATISIDASNSYDPDGTIVSYKWSVGTTAVVSGKHAMVNFAVGERIVTLEVTDNDGNVATAEKKVTIIAGNSDAPTYDLEVYTRSIDLHEDNVSKVRTYVRNRGTNSLSDFKLRYYFNIDSDETPVGEYWYIPKSTGTVGHLFGDTYYIELDYTGKTVLPNGAMPHAAGTVIAYHLPSWVDINYYDDFSFLDAEHFELNENVTVHDEDGNIIYGNAPEEQKEVLPNLYNLTVTNPIVHSKMIAFTYEDAGLTSGVLHFYNSNGSEFIEVYSGSVGVKINPIVFEEGKTYYAELVVDGVVDSRTYFYVPFK